MATRAEVRGRARAELNDIGVATLWSNAQLDRWLAEAIRDYGRALPRQATATLVTVAGQAAYPLPADWDGGPLLLVEHPAGRFRQEVATAGGDVAEEAALLEPIPPARQPYRYEVFAGQIWLRPAPAASGESVAVWYTATYPLPAADEEALATPAADDDLLVWFICGRALRWIGTDEAKRQRFERQRGASAQGMAREYEAEYQAALRARERRARQRRLVVRA